MTEHHWPVLFERHPHPMLIVDPVQLRVLGANAAFAGLLGLRREETIGRQLSELRADPAVPSLLESWLRAPRPPLPSEPRPLGVAAFRTAAGRPAQVGIAVSGIPCDRSEAVLCLLQDVTGEQRAAEALQRSHDRFVALTRAVNGVIWDYNLVTGEVWRGDGTEGIYGQPASELFPHLDDWLERLHPDDVARVRAGFHAAVESGADTWRDEYRLRQPDGSYLEVRDYAAILHDGRGRPVRMIGTAVDVSERTRAEQARLQSERRLRSLFESSMVGIVFGETDGTILDANDAFLRIVGYSRDDLLARRINVREITPPDQIPVTERALDAVRHARVPPYEKEYLRADGSRVPVLVSIATFPDTTGEGFAIVLDLSETKRAEAELAEHQRRLQALFDNTLDAILLFDDEGRHLDANPAACALYGCSREELLQRTLFDMAAPEDLEPLRASIRNLLATGRTRGERRQRRRDGSFVEVEGHAVAHIVPGVHMAVLRDLRERRESERALRGLSGRLLRMQDEERRRLARDIHDSTAQGLAALSLGLAVVGESADRLDPRGRKALDDAQGMVQECARELRTISYLLHPPLLDEMGLESALRGYVDGFARRSGIDVALELPGSEPRLPRDVETALFRIVQECLSNIHRHSGSPTARVRLLLDAESIVLEIADQGRGLPVPANGTLPATELGVGIAGMQERVRQLGGRLEFVSGGTGTTVRAVLPRVDA